LNPTPALPKGEGDVEGWIWNFDLRNPTPPDSHAGLPKGEGDVEGWLVRGRRAMG